MLGNKSDTKILKLIIMHVIIMAYTIDEENFSTDIVSKVQFVIKESNNKLHE